MKIALFISGQPRTLFNNFSHNIKVIKQKVGKCEIDVFYSLWDDLDRCPNINSSDHMWINSYVSMDLKPEIVDQYFVECGAKEVKGEIESIDIMRKVMEESPFIHQPGLSSQYYKTNRVVEKYFREDYDLYVKIRPDIMINDFIDNGYIEKLKDTKTLLVNQYYWFNALYNGSRVNEMIWASTKNSFKQTNELFCVQNEINNKSSAENKFGEALTCRYFNMLLSKNIISNIETFNFDYRVIR